MKLIQISVFLENKSGRLADVCALLGENKINIRALTIAESDDFGVLRMVVNRPEETLKILKENNFAASFTEIVAVEVDDKPGGLALILNIFKNNQVNIEYMYGFLEKFSEKALLVFRFEDIDKAIDILKKNKIKVIGKDDIINL